MRTHMFASGPSPTPAPIPPPPCFLSEAAQEVVAKMGTDWLIDSSELLFDSVKPIGAGGFAQVCVHVCML